MPDHLDQVTSAAPKNVEVAAVRVFAPELLGLGVPAWPSPCAYPNGPRPTIPASPAPRGEITGPAPPEPAARPRHRHGGQHADDGRPTARSRSRRQPPADSDEVARSFRDHVARCS